MGGTGVAGWRRWLRRLLTVALAAGLMAVGAAGLALWLIRERLHRTFDDVPLVELRAGPGNAAEGERLAYVYGCFGCHGDTLAGKDFYGIPSANLTRVVDGYDLNGFARLLRSGVRPDGTSPTWAMPSDFYSGMADGDVANLYAYLRSLPDRPDGEPRGRLSLAHVGLLTGDVLLAGEVAPPGDPPVEAPAPGDPAFGAYLTSLTCAECHGIDLRGHEGDTPSLRLMIDSYSPDAFRRLMKSGVSVGGVSDLRLMSRVARRNYSRLTAAEVDALYAYLRSLPD